MSKRTSEELSNAIEVPDPDNLLGGDDDTEVFEGSELDSAANEAPAGGAEEEMISCIQTTSGGCLLVSLWLIL
ncbi:hypothetical protein TrST_g7432 [Triparma strigata]|uniref:Uncharacterized protein n=1 Tax=Triparma strigata TaxID=1606541 RepID=A0A9W6ZGP4_9STRA|nr:hypothetical protein TrST_g7432 [Triparma strigata]